MAATDKRPDTSIDKTGDYSATKAPENREHVESDQPAKPDPSLIPGGPLGVPVEVGMSALYRENIPSQAENEHTPQDRPDRAGQPGDLHTRDRGGNVSPRTPDQAEGERGDGA